MKNPSFDLNVRYLDFDGRKIEIDYISSLCSDELIAYLVEGITNAKGKTLKDCLNNGDVKEELNKENVAERLKDADGIIVPGGFGDRGIAGMIDAIEYARTNKVPLLGICLGMQLITIEYARNVCGM